MLSIFAPDGMALRKTGPVDPAALPDSAVWIDLENPTPSEDRAVEGLAGVAVPTREDMQEIEISSRLYVENGARYMTASLMCGSETDRPRTTPVTFILSGHRLVTVRYDAPKPFALVENKLARAAAPRFDRREGVARIARCRDRSLRRHSGARRRRHRPSLATTFSSRTNPRALAVPNAIPKS